MRRALREFVVKGIKTSIPFHRVVMENPKFVSGHYDTTFIDREILGSGSELLPARGEEFDVAVMLAAIEAYRRDRDRAARGAAAQGDATTTSRWKQAGRARALRRGA
jgi:acetyl-CoA carboxylase biotin carboxylase subunit